MEFVGISLFLLTAVTSFFVTPLVVKLATTFNFLDHPETRKIHSNPTPKLGGVGIVCSVGFTSLATVILVHYGYLTLSLNESIWVPLLAGSVIVFLVGLWDDVTPLPISLKFGFQSVAAILAIAWGIRFDRVSFLGETGLDLGIFAYLITFLWIIGITNAFNLIDGLDGLSSGIASIAAGTSAVIFILRGNDGEAFLLVMVLGALIGFLRYNFYPAKIFLGDSGSLLIGYILALTAITGSQNGGSALAITFLLLVFGLPIADTLLSMVRRYLRELQMKDPSKGLVKHKLLMMKRMFEPDRDHIHHRLLAVGFSHRGAVLLLYGLGLVLSLLAFLSVVTNERTSGLILVLVAFASCIGISKLGYREFCVIQTQPRLRIQERFFSQNVFFRSLVDFLLITLSYWTAFFLNYHLMGSHEVLSWYQTGFLITLPVQWGILCLFGLYKRVWPPFGTGDLLPVVCVVGIGTACSLVLTTINGPSSGIVGFFAVDGLLLAGCTLLLRRTYRMVNYFSRSQDQSGSEVLIYGTGKGGQFVFREVMEKSEQSLRPLGFLDGDPASREYTLTRFPILGSWEDLDQILVKHPNAHLVLNSTDIDPLQLETVKRVCQLYGVPLYRFGLPLGSLDPVLPEINNEGLFAERPRKQKHPQLTLRTQPEREPAYD